MDRAVLADRRRASRRAPEGHEPLCRVRLRTGRELDVVDISASGVLAEGQTRLLPNTHVDLHVITRAGRLLVRCRVVRAFVCCLEAELVRYRVALAFDRSLDVTAGYGLPSSLANDSDGQGSAYPHAAPSAHALEPDRLSA